LFFLGYPALDVPASGGYFYSDCISEVMDFGDGMVVLVVLRDEELYGFGVFVLLGEEVEFSYEGECL
jgi:hypothetical protein